MEDFCPIVHRIFDVYFADRGASCISEGVARIETGQPRPTRGAANSYFIGAPGDSDVVRYQSSLWFAEVERLWKDGPRYCPRMHIGALVPNHADLRRRSVDICHTVPAEHELRRYNFLWRYTSPVECAAALTKVRDLILEPFARPYLDDVPRLIALLSARARELDQEWQEQIDSHNESILRTAAEEAFREKDYEQVDRNYSRIDNARLSQLERQKLEFAKSRLSQ